MVDHHSMDRLKSRESVSCVDRKANFPCSKAKHSSMPFWTAETAWFILVGFVTLPVVDVSPSNNDLGLSIRIPVLPSVAEPPPVDQHAGKVADPSLAPARRCKASEIPGDVTYEDLPTGRANPLYSTTSTSSCLLGDNTECQHTTRTYAARPPRSGVQCSIDVLYRPDGAFRVYRGITFTYATDSLVKAMAGIDMSRLHSIYGEKIARPTNLFVEHN